MIFVKSLKQWLLPEAWKESHTVTWGEVEKNWTLWTWHSNIDLILKLVLVGTGGRGDAGGRSDTGGGFGTVVVVPFNRMWHKGGAIIFFGSDVS